MPGTSAAAQNDVLATCGDHHVACFIRPRASVNAAHGRLFRFVLPARIHFRGLAPHCVDTSEVNADGGMLLQSSTNGKHFEFQIVIPASYKIIARDVGTVTGMLDGEQYERKERFLSGGIHTFARTSTGRDLVVFWAQARPIESNTSPHS